MYEFFSGIIDEKGKVYTLGNTSSHEEIIKEFKLNDKKPLPLRKWARFELTPKSNIFDKLDDWKFKVDEISKPDWLNKFHEQCCREYLQENILDTKWFKATQTEIKFIKEIKWFTSMDEPKLEDLLPLAQEMGKAFKIKGKIKVKLICLGESAAWSAARSAAESAAWSAAWSAAESAAWSAARSAARSAAWSAAESAAESAAWSAARSAAFEASADVNKKYKTNPFKLMIQLWAKGFYCCGIDNKTLTLGYVKKR